MSKDTQELSRLVSLLLEVTKQGDLIIGGTVFLDAKQTINNLNRELVRNALIILQERHPFLRSYLLKDKKSII